ncbi:MAG: SAM-dependent methyltransferase [Bacteroidetes bacterium]|nr:SAM-dependent methyltransferase [Bacteroidota bacterium]
MKTNSVSRTAQGAAAGRAIENHRPREDRLFEDPFARGLLKPAYRLIVDVMRVRRIREPLLAMRERQFPGAIGNLLCRTRYIDDAFHDALQKGLDQVVLLGAGFDSRAYRIPRIERTRVFEVDHPATQAYKRSRLRLILDAPPSHVTFVPVDFDRQKLDGAMREAGFRADAKTFFLWEGVTQYITAEAVDDTFRWVSGSAAAGSRIVFTYIHKGILDGSFLANNAQRILSDLERLGEPWLFGLDPAELDGYLTQRGLDLIEQVGSSEYQDRYLKPMRRALDIFEGELTVLANLGRSS